jgi:hypothetical protein
LQARCFENFFINLPQTIMQKNKTLATGIVALFLLTAIPSTYAFGGFERNGNRQKNFNNEKHIAIQKAFENQDYASFIESTKKTQLTEEEFAQIITKKEEKKANREEIKNAIKNGDYQTWKTLAEETNRSPMLDIITEDNFSKLQELHTAKEAGDFDTMQKIHEELGVDIGYGRKANNKKRRGGYMNR